jgi:hypothetical protein
MKNSYFFIFVRLLFGLSLIALSLKTLTQVNQIQPYVTQTIDQIQHKLLKKALDISHLKQHSQNVVFLEAFLLLSSGLFTIFGFRLSKILITLLVIIDLVMIHNLYFYKEQKHIVSASLIVGLMGGVFNLV